MKQNVRTCTPLPCCDPTIVDSPQAARLGPIACLICFRKSVLNRNQHVICVFQAARVSRVTSKISPHLCQQLRMPQPREHDPPDIRRLSGPHGVQICPCRVLIADICLQGEQMHTQHKRNLLPAASLHLFHDQPQARSGPVLPGKRGR